MTFITPVTPYTRLLAFLLFRAPSAQEAQAELRRRNLTYIYPDFDKLKADYDAMVASMPAEVDGWRRFKPARGVKPIPDMNVEGWCDEHEILKFYQQVTLSGLVPVDGDFMAAWDLFTTKGSIRNAIEAMKLAQMHTGTIQTNLAAFNTTADLAVLDNYFSYFFFELDMSADDIWIWVNSLRGFARDNPSLVAEADSKRVAVTAPGDLFSIIRRLGTTCKVEPAEMLAEMRAEMFGTFWEAADRHERNLRTKREQRRLGESIDMMKKCLDAVRGTMEIGAELGVDQPRKHKRQEIAFISNRNLRSKAQVIAEGEEIADRKQLPAKGEGN